MKQFKSPNLKASELKVPPVLRDLYSDLRDRRLLPLLGLVLVAIVAVPFLLKESPEATEAPAPIAGGSAGAAQASALTVVEATPGLRDYRRRLRAQAPTNPFKQRFSGPMLKGAKLRSVIETGESADISSSPSGDSGAGAAAPVGSPPDPTGGESGSTKPGGTTAPPDGLPAQAFTFAMTVQISRTEEDGSGRTKMGEPAVHEGVRPLTPLPGEKAPVVTYLGANIETGKAIFMVSHDVTAVFGDAKCISGTDRCELMEVEPGFPETFEFGPNKVRYKFNVLELEVVRTGKSDKP